MRPHRQEVLVAEFGCVAGWLKRSHHELVLLRDRLLDALFLLHVGHLVLDLVQFQSLVSLPVSLVGGRSIKALLEDHKCLAVSVIADLLFEYLFNLEGYALALNLAMTVVNLDFSLCYFQRSEHVLVELSLKACGALVAAADFDIRGHRDSLVVVQLDRTLPYHHHLLVLHVLASTVELRLHEVLYLGLRFGPAFLVLEEQRRGKDVRELEAETGLVVTRRDL